MGSKYGEPQYRPYTIYLELPVVLQQATYSQFPLSDPDTVWRLSVWRSNLGILDDATTLLRSPSRLSDLNLIRLSEDVIVPVDASYDTLHPCRVISTTNSDNILNESLSSQVPDPRIYGFDIYLPSNLKPHHLVINVGVVYGGEVKANAAVFVNLLGFGTTDYLHLDGNSLNRITQSSDNIVHLPVGVSCSSNINLTSPLTSKLELSCSLGFTWYPRSDSNDDVMNTMIQYIPPFATPLSVTRKLIQSRVDHIANSLTDISELSKLRPDVIPSRRLCVRIRDFLLHSRPFQFLTSVHFHSGHSISVSSSDEFRKLKFYASISRDSGELLTTPVLIGSATATEKGSSRIFITDPTVGEPASVPSLERGCQKVAARAHSSRNSDQLVSSTSSSILNSEGGALESFWELDTINTIDTVLPVPVEYEDTRCADVHLLMYIVVDTSPLKPTSVTSTESGSGTEEVVVGYSYLRLFDDDERFFTSPLSSLLSEWNICDVHGFEAYGSGPGALSLGVSTAVHCGSPPYLPSVDGVASFGARFPSTVVEGDAYVPPVGLSLSSQQSGGSTAGGWQLNPAFLQQKPADMCCGALSSTHQKHGEKEGGDHDFDEQVQCSKHRAVLLGGSADFVSEITGLSSAVHSEREQAGVGRLHSITHPRSSILNAQNSIPAHLKLLQPSVGPPPKWHRPTHHPFQSNALRERRRDQDYIPPGRAFVKVDDPYYLQSAGLFPVALSLEISVVSNLEEDLCISQQSMKELLALSQALDEVESESDHAHVVKTHVVAHSLRIGSVATVRINLEDALDNLLTQGLGLSFKSMHSPSKGFSRRLNDATHPLRPNIITPSTDVHASLLGLMSRLVGLYARAMGRLRSLNLPGSPVDALSSSFHSNSITGYAMLLAARAGLLTPLRPASTSGAVREALEQAKSDIRAASASLLLISRVFSLLFEQHSMPGYISYLVWGWLEASSTRVGTSGQASVQNDDHSHHDIRNGGLEGFESALVIDSSSGEVNVVPLSSVSRHRDRSGSVGGFRSSSAQASRSSTPYTIGDLDVFDEGTGDETRLHAGTAAAHAGGNGAIQKMQLVAAKALKVLTPFSSPPTHAKSFRNAVTNTNVLRELGAGFDRGKNSSPSAGRNLVHLDSRDSLNPVNAMKSLHPASISRSSSVGSLTQIAPHPQEQNNPVFHHPPRVSELNQRGNGMGARTLSVFARTRKAQRGIEVPLSVTAGGATNPLLQLGSEVQLRANSLQTQHAPRRSDFTDVDSEATEVVHLEEDMEDIVIPTRLDFAPGIMAPGPLDAILTVLQAAATARLLAWKSTSRVVHQSRSKSISYLNDWSFSLLDWASVLSSALVAAAASGQFMSVTLRPIDFHVTSLESQLGGREDLRLPPLAESPLPNLSSALCSLLLSAIEGTYEVRRALKAVVEASTLGRGLSSRRDPSTLTFDSFEEALEETLMNISAALQRVRHALVALPILTNPVDGAHQPQKGMKDTPVASLFSQAIAALFCDLDANDSVLARSSAASRPNSSKEIERISPFSVSAGLNLDSKVDAFELSKSSGSGDGSDLNSELDLLALLGSKLPEEIDTPPIAGDSKVERNESSAIVLLPPTTHGQGVIQKYKMQGLGNSGAVDMGLRGSMSERIRTHQQLRMRSQIDALTSSGVRDPLVHHPTVVLTSSGPNLGASLPPVTPSNPPDGMVQVRLRPSRLDMGSLRGDQTLSGTCSASFSGTATVSPGMTSSSGQLHLGGIVGPVQSDGLQLRVPLQLQPAGFLVAAEVWRAPLPSCALSRQDPLVSPTFRSKMGAEGSADVLRRLAASLLAPSPLQQRSYFVSGPAIPLPGSVPLSQGNHSDTSSCRKEPLNAAVGALLLSLVRRELESLVRDLARRLHALPSSSTAGGLLDSSSSLDGDDADSGDGFEAQRFHSLLNLLPLALFGGGSTPSLVLLEPLWAAAAYTSALEHVLATQAGSFSTSVSPLEAGTVDVTELQRVSERVTAPPVAPVLASLGSQLTLMALRATHAALLAASLPQPLFSRSSTERNNSATNVSPIATLRALRLVGAAETPLRLQLARLNAVVGVPTARLRWSLLRLDSYSLPLVTSAFSQLSVPSSHTSNQRIDVSLVEWLQGLLDAAVENPADGFVMTMLGGAAAARGLAAASDTAPGVLLESFPDLLDSLETSSTQMQMYLRGGAAVPGLPPSLLPLLSIDPPALLRTLLLKLAPSSSSSSSQSPSATTLSEDILPDVIADVEAAIILSDEFAERCWGMITSTSTAGKPRLRSPAGAMLVELVETVLSTTFAKPTCSSSPKAQGDGSGALAAVVWPILGSSICALAQQLSSKGGEKANLLSEQRLALLASLGQLCISLLAAALAHWARLVELGLSGSFLLAATSTLQRCIRALHTAELALAVAVDYEAACERLTTFLLLPSTSVDRMETNKFVSRASLGLSCPYETLPIGPGRILKSLVLRTAALWTAVGSHAAFRESQQPLMHATAQFAQKDASAFRELDTLCAGCSRHSRPLAAPPRAASTGSSSKKSDRKSSLSLEGLSSPPKHPISTSQTHQCSFIVGPPLLRSSALADRPLVVSLTTAAPMLGATLLLGALQTQWSKATQLADALQLALQALLREDSLVLASLRPHLAFVICNSNETLLKKPNEGRIPTPENTAVIPGLELFEHVTSAPLLTRLDHAATALAALYAPAAAALRMCLVVALDRSLGLKKALSLKVNISSPARPSTQMDWIENDLISGLLLPPCSESCICVLPTPQGPVTKPKIQLGGRCSVCGGCTCGSAPLGVLGGRVHSLSKSAQVNSPLPLAAHALAAAASALEAAYDYEALWGTGLSDALATSPSVFHSNAIISWSLTRGIVGRFGSTSNSKASLLTEKGAFTSEVELRIKQQQRKTSSLQKEILEESSLLRPHSSFSCSSDLANGSTSNEHTAELPPGERPSFRLLNRMRHLFEQLRSHMAAFSLAVAAGLIPLALACALQLRRRLLTLLGRAGLGEPISRLLPLLSQLPPSGGSVSRNLLMAAVEGLMLEPSKVSSVPPSQAAFLALRVAAAPSVASRRTLKLELRPSTQLPPRKSTISTSPAVQNASSQPQNHSPQRGDVAGRMGMIGLHYIESQSSLKMTGNRSRFAQTVRQPAISTSNATPHALSPSAIPELPSHMHSHNSIESTSGPAVLKEPLDPQSPAVSELSLVLLEAAAVLLLDVSLAGDLVARLRAHAHSQRDFEYLHQLTDRLVPAFPSSPKSENEDMRENDQEEFRYLRHLTRLVTGFAGMPLTSSLRHAFNGINEGLPVVLPPRFLLTGFFNFDPYPNAKNEESEASGCVNVIDGMRWQIGPLPNDLTLDEYASILRSQYANSRATIMGPAAAASFASVISSTSTSTPPSKHSSSSTGIDTFSQNGLNTALLFCGAGSAAVNAREAAPAYLQSLLDDSLVASSFETSNIPSAESKSNPVVVQRASDAAAWAAFETLFASSPASVSSLIPEKALQMSPHGRAVCVDGAPKIFIYQIYPADISCLQGTSSAPLIAAGISGSPEELPAFEPLREEPSWGSAFRGFLSCGELVECSISPLSAASTKVNGSAGMSVSKTKNSVGISSKLTFPPLSQVSGPVLYRGGFKLNRAIPDALLTGTAPQSSDVVASGARLHAVAAAVLSVAKTQSHSTSSAETVRRMAATGSVAVSLSPAAAREAWCALLPSSEAGLARALTTHCSLPTPVEDAVRPDKWSVLNIIPLLTAPLPSEYSIAGRFFLAGTSATRELEYSCAGNSSKDQFMLFPAPHVSLNSPCQAVFGVESLSALKSSSSGGFPRKHLDSVLQKYPVCLTSSPLVFTSISPAVAAHQRMQAQMVLMNSTLKWLMNQNFLLYAQEAQDGDVLLNRESWRKELSSPILSPFPPSAATSLVHLSSKQIHEFMSVSETAFNLPKLALISNTGSNAPEKSKETGKEKGASLEARKSAEKLMKLLRDLTLPIDASSMPLHELPLSFLLYFGAEGFMPPTISPFQLHSSKNIGGAGGKQVIGTRWRVCEPSPHQQYFQLLSPAFLSIEVLANSEASSAAAAAAHLCLTRHPAPPPALFRSPSGPAAAAALGVAFTPAVDTPALLMRFRAVQAEQLSKQARLQPRVAPAPRPLSHVAGTAPLALLTTSYDNPASSTNQNKDGIVTFTVPVSLTETAVWTALRIATSRLEEGHWGRAASARTAARALADFHDLKVLEKEKATTEMRRQYYRWEALQRAAGVDVDSLPTPDWDNAFAFQWPSSMHVLENVFGNYVLAYSRLLHGLECVVALELPMNAMKAGNSSGELIDQEKWRVTEVAELIRIRSQFDFTFGGIQYP